MLTNIFTSLLITATYAANLHSYGQAAPAPATLVPAKLEALKQVVGKSEDTPLNCNWGK